MTAFSSPFHQRIDPKLHGEFLFAKAVHISPPASLIPFHRPSCDLGAISTMIKPEAMVDKNPKSLPEYHVARKGATSSSWFVELKGCRQWDAIGSNAYLIKVTSLQISCAGSISCWIPLLHVVRHEIEQTNKKKLAVLCALLEMVKWPFWKFKWPSTRGSKRTLWIT